MTNPHFTDPLEVHLDISSDEHNAVDLLSQSTSLSKQCIKHTMQKGAVWLSHRGYTQRLRRAKKNLHNGDSLHLYYNEKILSSTPQAPTLIADHGAYSIWNKPYGMYCQGSKWGDHCTINRWIEQHRQQPAFIVHRLDRATTGLIIIAHQKKTAAALAKLFEQRNIKKRYRALVQGAFPLDEGVVTLQQAVDGRTAISHVRGIEYNATSHQSRVEVTIETGRKHQIRQHLAAAGYPIVGDRLYGNGDDSLDLQLCCFFLAFTCPLTHEDRVYSLD